MGSIVYTPAVQERLNVAVVNQFRSGFGAAASRISGLLDICGPRTTTELFIVTLILGKNFKLRRRDFDSDEQTKRGVNIYEQRAALANYVDFLSMRRVDALYDKIERLMASAELEGASAGEAPTRMIEALVPSALAINDYLGTPYFFTGKALKPGSTTTWGNVEDLGPLDFDSYDAAEERLAKLPDEDGRACGSQVTVLAVGQKYKQIGREIVENPRPKDYAGGDNLRSRDGARLIVVPDWDDDFWAVFDTRTDGDMPFYFVEGRALTVMPLHTDPMSAWCIENNELLWAVDGDLATALGNSRRAFMSANPAQAAAIAAKYASRYELNDFSFPDA